MLLPSLKVKALRMHAGSVGISEVVSSIYSELVLFCSERCTGRRRRRSDLGCNDGILGWVQQHSHFLINEKCSMDGMGVPFRSFLYMSLLYVRKHFVILRFHPAFAAANVCLPTHATRPSKGFVMQTADSARPWCGGEERVLRAIAR